MQEQVSYAQAIATKYPEQVVVAIARDPQGKYNPITLGWTMIASSQPPMMALAVGKTRYSCEAIRHSREFVIAFPSEHQSREVMLFGTASGRDTDKLAASGVATTPAARIDGRLLCDAVANFECTLVGELDAGDHVIFLAEVVSAHRNSEPLNRLYTVAAGYKLAGIPPGEE